MKSIATTLFAIYIIGCRDPSAEIPTPMTSAKYKIGQVWNYQTRKGEEQSRIFIVRADSNQKIGTIYHIYIDGLQIRNPHTNTGIQDHLPHSPVSEKTLNDSVTSLAIEHADEVPDVSDGYKTWKEAFDKGEGGIFTIPVNQIIQHIEDIITGKRDNG